MSNILFREIDVLNGLGESFQDVNVIVSEGKIAYIGKGFPNHIPAASKIVQGAGKLLIPGLYNTHTHIVMNCMRGYAEDLELQEWLNTKVYPVEDRLDPEIVKICSNLALADLIRNGTVSFSDQYFFCDSICEATAYSGLKANISRSCVGGTDYDSQKDRRLAEAIQTFKRFNGYDSGRIKVDFSVHAEYSSSPKVWNAVAEAAHEYGAGISFHLSETRTEQEACIRRYGKTPTQLFADAGLLGPKSYGAHGVWLSDEDREILSQTETSIIHCPVSNLKLGSGVAAVSRLKDAGVNIGIGTDGAASNNCLDLFEEMKTAVLLSRGVRTEDKPLKALDALRMATVNGAKSQNRKGGTLAVGEDADLVMINTRVPSLTPNHDSVSTVVYSAVGRDVDLTMVRGKILYENGDFKTIDYERARHDFFKICAPKLFLK